jgi:hypothetical protein
MESLFGGEEEWGLTMGWGNGKSHIPESRSWYGPEGIGVAPPRHGQGNRGGAARWVIRGSSGVQRRLALWR